MRKVLALIPTTLLCLPSLAGGIALVGNALLGHRITEWNLASSASVAAAVILGGPLVVVAAIIAAVMAFSPRVSMGIKYANYAIVTVAGIATFSLVFGFGM